MEFIDCIVPNPFMEEPLLITASAGRSLSFVDPSPYVSATIGFMLYSLIARFTDPPSIIVISAPLSLTAFKQAASSFSSMQSNLGLASLYRLWYM